MNGKVNGIIGLVLLAVIVGAANLVISTLPLRKDLTAEKLYTLSDGSRAVLGKLESDVTLKYYFSESSPEMTMTLKDYARQVGNLLSEYARSSNGKLVLEQYDPKPDSDAEEWAQRYGIEPQTVNPFGQSVYFGLVAVCGDREETLSRLSPRTESTLEYDVTRLITRVAWPERPQIGVLSSIPGVLAEQMNPMMMQSGQRPQQGWATLNELKKDYDVRQIDAAAESIDADVKALIVIHPKNLSDKTLFAIDQFVLRGGRLIACVDPFSYMDIVSSRQQSNPMMMQMGGQDGPSTLGKLFTAWGVKFDESKLVIDMAASTPLPSGNGQVEENPAFLSLDGANMAKKDLLVSRLTQVMLPFSGAFAFENKEGIVAEPLIFTSTENTCLVNASGLKMGGLDAVRSEIKPDGVQRVLAARITGEFKTAFPLGADPTSTNSTQSLIKEGKGAVVLFGDSDFLADGFSVQVMNTPFGTITRPMNENIVLFMNVIEQLAGREELIGVRARGQSNRPFVKVDELEAKALSKWQEKQTQFEHELADTRRRLMELQKQKGDNDRLILSQEQQDEIIRLRKVQADTSRQLKNVRRELTSEIDTLGLTLKLVNIVLVPLLVVAFGIVYGLRRRKRTAKK
jgi:ABC-type uncharacterized transport system involved in gliding motility auxiliary subunit